MQADVVQLALGLLVREPDVEGFFAGITKNMVEESESHGCGVWLLDESGEQCKLWMAYIGEQLYVDGKHDLNLLPFPHQSLADHLIALRDRVPREVRNV